MESPYTRTFYKHAGVLVDRNDRSNYKVVAKTNLRKGTLLLIEHCLCESMQTMVSVVQQCAVLSRNLHPREPGVGEVNSFGSDDISQHTLGFDISAFNHSCNPNAAVHAGTVPDVARLTILLSVFAINEIAAGEEICIAYNASAGLGLRA
jgi:hypothetical protein